MWTMSTPHDVIEISHEGIRVHRVARYKYTELKAHFEYNCNWILSIQLKWLVAWDSS